FGDSLCHLHRRDYQKNRFRVRPALDLKDPIDCRVVEWIRAEPVRCVGGRIHDSGFDYRYSVALERRPHLVRKSPAILRRQHSETGMISRVFKWGTFLGIAAV